jgi:hypothetical protein
MSAVTSCYSLTAAVTRGATDEDGADDAALGNHELAVAVLVVIQCDHCVPVGGMEATDGREVDAGDLEHRDGNGPVVTAVAAERVLGGYLALLDRGGPQAVHVAVVLGDVRRRRTRCGRWCAAPQ